ncbi:hypothetical protein GQ457_08G025860 [Hibiscus cannabinus]
MGEFLQRRPTVLLRHLWGHSSLTLCISGRDNAKGLNLILEPKTRPVISSRYLVNWWEEAFNRQKGDLITRTYPDPHKKVHLFAVAIYGLVLFPRILGYIDVTVFETFNQFQYYISPVPTILAETFLSLNAYRQLEGGRFKGCAPLL